MTCPFSRLYKGIATTLQILSACCLTSCAQHILKHQAHRMYSGHERLWSKARTDCRGDEIIGVWAMKNGELRYLPFETKTLLIKSDGTGRIRTSPSAGLLPIEELLTWKYGGHGAWTAEITGKAVGKFGDVQRTPSNVYSYSGNTFQLRWTGDSLVWRMDLSDYLGPGKVGGGFDIYQRVPN